MYTNKKFGALSSSEDPQKLADTVKGLIISLSGVIILVLHVFDINIMAEQVSLFATELAFSIGSILTIYGLIKKFIIWIQDTVQNRTNPA